MPYGRLRPVFDPAMVRPGVALPFAPAANTSTVWLEKFATRSSPDASIVRPSGALRPVLLPVIVRIGATLPFAVGPYTVITGLRRSDRYELPLASTATP